MLPLVRINNFILPVAPLLWYREQEIMCPIEYINTDIPLGDLDILPEYKSDLTFIIVQRNILSDANLYISLHNFAFYHLTKKNIIDDQFNHNFIFQVIIKKINIYDSVTNITPLNISTETLCNHSVFIHGAAFSPPGTLHFKADHQNAFNCILMYASCSELNIQCKCLFFIVNDFNGRVIDEVINDIVTKIKEKYD
jgi:hypothetical protein